MSMIIYNYMKNKYQVTMTQTFYILAEDDIQAEDMAIERCASDTDLLLPCNMAIAVEETTLPDSFFD